MYYWRFRILATGKDAFVKASSRGEAIERLSSYGFKPVQIVLLGLTNESIVCWSGADIY